MLEGSDSRNTEVEKICRKI